MGIRSRRDAHPGTVESAGVALLVILLLGGCTTTRLFHADFQADAIGDEPAISPPTQPTGDYISYSPTSSGQQWLEVSSLMGKSLMVRSAPTGHSLAYVGIEKPHGSNPVYTSYTGAALGVSADGPALSIVLQGAGHDQLVAGTTFRNGKVYRGVHAQPSAADLLGEIKYAEPHVVIVAVDPAAKTYDLSILQSGAEDIFRMDQPIDNDALFGSGRLTLVVLTEPGGEAGNPMYIMDDVLMTQKKPNTAALEAAAAGKPKP